jgi:DNA-binding CsgD family transcriptional regulator
MEGKTVAEIAAELNISPKTVETQIQRAKATLRERISKLLYLAITVTLTM